MSKGPAFRGAQLEPQAKLIREKAIRKEGIPREFKMSPSSVVDRKMDVEARATAKLTECPWRAQGGPRERRASEAAGA